MEIRYKKGEWTKMVIIREPTEKTGQVRMDENSNVVEWSGGTCRKYVTAKKLTEMAWK